MLSSLKTQTNKTHKQTKQTNKNKTNKQTGTCQGQVIVLFCYFLASVFLMTVLPNQYIHNLEIFHCLFHTEFVDVPLKQEQTCLSTITRHSKNRACIHKSNLPCIIVS